ncbi:MAG: hypothetical protein EHM58_00410 [Ignavibacteriae bacterium]|nr:MAG: hypothetical protein EHM58_00410 [Ignavibacteriota bacterium]
MNKIFLLAFIQSLYDFAGWFGIIQHWLKVTEDKWQAKLYRLIKELLDIPVTFVLLYYFFQVDISIILAFYTAKWFHICDSFYNVEEYIVTNQPTTNWGYWRFWTPLGLLRTNFWGLCLVKGYTKLDYDERTGNWGNGYNIYTKYPQYKAHFLKGMVSVKEAWIQTLIGLLLALIIIKLGNIYQF